MKKTFSLIYLAVFCTLWSATHAVNPSGTALSFNLSEQERCITSMSQTFSEVINYMIQNYYKTLSCKELEEAFSQAIKSFAHRDPHSGFLDAKECTSLQEKMSGEFFGVGIVLPGFKETESEFLPVVEVVPEGPAEKSGIKPGDKILEVNDTIVKDLTIEEIIALIKGEKGTKVVLKIMRDKYPEPISIETHRDVIKDEISLIFYLPEQNIAYLMLSIFSEKSAAHVKKLLEFANQKNVNGIIIDLRNNTGGLLDSAVEISSLFLPKGSLVAVTKNREHKVTEKWQTKTAPLARPKNTPIFFIINNYTASAAEILAGTLSLYSQKESEKLDLFVFTVGINSFGKGSVQEVVPLSNNCALRMTSALYYLPFDTLIQGKGIQPDFLVEPRTPPSEAVKWINSQYGRESSLKGSIKPHDHVEEKKDTKKDAQEEMCWKDKRKKILSEDYMVQNTVDLINLLTLHKKLYPYSSYNTQLQFLKNNFVLDNPLKLEEIGL